MSPTSYSWYVSQQEIMLILKKQRPSFYPSSFCGPCEVCGKQNSKLLYKPDVCRCSTNCPNRQLQRGRNKAFVVYHEDNLRGFGLRAAIKDIKIGETVTISYWEKDKL
ncbi:hypothetical protein GCK72_022649 [Caenorhabditis remanei]|uniref:SET domain-containing protein n=1 Tax=Caenorhabditis remanei TaxID=31234 RepID=A0A6A5FUM0_CAERE|nr:hypothetical protein GCK72_022649 [Caenorhabditis remanei]KAF1746196.1 hypothetical protein GCK72_022649 [Caenorhabditis remanei]